MPNAPRLRPLRLKILRYYDGRAISLMELKPGELVDALPWFADCLIDCGYAVLIGVGGPGR